MIRPPCYICDALTLEYADLLCAQHWQLGCVAELVQCGAWSEFDANEYGVRPNHAAMMRQPPQTPRYWQAVLLAALNVKRVTWDDGSGDTRDSLTDRYTLLTGLVPTWIYDAMLRAMVEQRKGRAA